MLGYIVRLCPKWTKQGYTADCPYPPSLELAKLSPTIPLTRHLSPESTSTSRHHARCASKIKIRHAGKSLFTLPEYLTAYRIITLNLAASAIDALDHVLAHDLLH
jgi:hypothetical protein